MNSVEFDHIVKDCICKITSTLASKGKEYSSKADRLHNFKFAAQRQGLTPAKTLMMFREKQEVSVVNMVNNIQANPKTIYTKEYINEKIGDNINYLILLKALLFEEYGYKP